MKLTKINNIKTLALALCMGGLMASCSDSIDLPSMDEELYTSPTESLAFLTNKYGASNVDSLYFSDNGSTDFYVNLLKPASSAQTFTIVYDLKALNTYNMANGTKVEALPEDLVTIAGDATVAAGESKSAAVKISYKSAEALAKNGLYAIPLVVKGSGAEASKEKGEFVLMLRDITKMPDCHKENGLQVISCMEINDANPLYNLSFTLEKSGKYLFDQVILFSGNINYNEETGEVYNYNNENIAHCLKYKEKYIEPLQRKGMKVILGILGNHDRSGVANLTKEGAKAFAKELKAVCDAYNLDGVMFDDEYSSYGSYPGFATPSASAAARLCYETKQAMPDKLVQTYVYGKLSYLPSVDGHAPGTFIDYANQDYRVMGDLSNDYEGLPKKAMIQASIELARGYASSASTYRNIREAGYGGTMFFGLSPKRTYPEIFNRVANAFYDENVLIGERIEKDW